MHGSVTRVFILAPLFALLYAGTPMSATAATVVVPGDFATIQGAIDSSTAEVIQIRDGDYAERLVVNRRVTLEPYPTGDIHNPQSFPSVLGLTLAVTPSTNFASEGLRFRGKAVISGTAGEVGFESCRFDSGFATGALTEAGPLYHLTMGSCQVFGGATANGLGISIRQCAFIGGGLAVGTTGWLDVRGNYILGPAAIGLKIVGGMAIGSASDNVIIGAQDGVVLMGIMGNPYPSIIGNEVLDCSGTAFRVTAGGGGSVVVSKNRVRRCGGDGFEVPIAPFDFRIESNEVDSVGGQGIAIFSQGGPYMCSIKSNTVAHVGKHGILYSNWWTGQIAITVSDNRVLDAGADGIRVPAPLLMERNVVGRCVGAGIVVDTARAEGAMVVRSNTVFLNGESGLRLHGTSADSVHHNLAHGNTRYGLEWTSAGMPALACDDWHGNTMGATQGVSPGGTDLQVNPLFCDLLHDDVTLSSVSALANAPGCGLIGALGVGCSYPTAVQERPTEPLWPGLSVMPQPSAGVVRFAWREVGQPARLEIYDVAGARHWESAVGAGQQELRWEGVDRSGRALAAGVYFVRLVGPSVDEKQRLVLVR